MVRSYLDLTIKFHDYSSFFTAFDVANDSIITLTHVACTRRLHRGST